jgi:putative membrane protein
MSDTPQRRAPVALEIEASAKPARAPAIIEERDFTEEVAPVAPVAEPPRVKRFSWVGAAIWGAALSLIGLYLVDAAWDLVLRLGAKNPLLGQIGLGMVAIVALALLAWLASEILALLRLRKVEALRERIRTARLTKTLADAKDAVGALCAFYAKDATTTAARAELAELDAGIHDPLTRLDEAERLLLSAKDAAARDAIATAAQRVSVVTAVSPRALIDVMFVLAQSIRLIRQLSAIYGGRASGLGLMRLATKIAGHVAITGGMAAADSVISEVVGSGLAARLSAKLGEGVLNGVLTARIGIAAASLCRPAEFSANSPILLSEVVKNSLLQKQVAEKPAA